MATACGGLLCGHAFGLKLPQLLHVVFELPGKGGVLAEGLDIVERVPVRTGGRPVMSPSVKCQLTLLVSWKKLGL